MAFGGIVRMMRRRRKIERRGNNINNILLLVFFARETYWPSVDLITKNVWTLTYDWIHFCWCLGRGYFTSLPPFPISLFFEIFRGWILLLSKFLRRPLFCLLAVWWSRSLSVRVRDVALACSSGRWCLFSGVVSSIPTPAFFPAPSFSCPAVSVD